MSKIYMRIIVKPPNKAPKVIRVQKRIKDLENLVGGIVELKRYDDVLIAYNQEQESVELKRNKIFKDLSMKGTIVIVGNEEKDRDIRSLKTEEISKYLKKINIPKRSIENEI